MDSVKRRSIIYKSIIILFSAVLLYFAVALFLIREYFFAGCFVLTSVINIVRTIRGKTELTVGAVFAIGINIALTLFGTRRTFAKHEEYVCSDRFGPEFNGRREYKRIPVIPPGWKKIDSGRWTVWRGDTSQLGHYSKDIFIDSACRVDLEDDDTSLNPLVTSPGRYR